MRSFCTFLHYLFIASQLISKSQRLSACNACCHRTHHGFSPQLGSTCSFRVVNGGKEHNMLKSVARWTVVVSMTACWPRARAAAAAGIMMHSPRRIRVSFRSAPPTMRTAFIARVAFSRPMPTLAPTPPQLFRRQRRSPGSQACCRIGRARHTRCAVGKHASEMEEATGTAATVRSPGSPYVAVLAPSLTEGAVLGALLSVGVLRGQYSH